MGKLRDQMLADPQLRGATQRTQKISLREVENFAKYFNRSPAELGKDELKEYMLHLMKERQLSDGTYRFYVAALKRDPAIICGSCAPSMYAEPLSLAAIWRYRITPSGTGTAPNARP